MRATSLWITASAVAGLLAVASPASAGLVEVELFNNIVYTQSTASAPTTPSFYFINIAGQTNNAGDFDSASVTYPGPASPESLPISGTNFGNGPAFATEADLHAAYPFGDYSISAHNSVTNATQNAVLNRTDLRLCHRENPLRSVEENRALHCLHRWNRRSFCRSGFGDASCFAAKV